MGRGGKGKDLRAGRRSPAPVSVGGPPPPARGALYAPDSGMLLGRAAPRVGFEPAYKTCSLFPVYPGASRENKKHTLFSRQSWPGGATNDAAARRRVSFLLRGPAEEASSAAAAASAASSVAPASSVAAPSASHVEARLLHCIRSSGRPEWKSAAAPSTSAASYRSPRSLRKGLSPRPARPARPAGWRRL